MVPRTDPHFVVSAISNFKSDQRVADMELNIFALAFTSAMLHPWREFFIKQNKNPEGACLAAMIVWTTLAALHAFIEGIDLFSIQLIWPITLASGLGFICFFIFALRTYRDGDFSSYYPITRADPLFIAIISFLFLVHLLQSWQL